MVIASIIYKINPYTGYKYAYESHSYRDPVTKRPRTKQKYLGRVDPVTNEIRPKGENGKRNRYRPFDQLEEMKTQVEGYKRDLQNAKETIDSLKQRMGKSEDICRQLYRILDPYMKELPDDSSVTEEYRTGGNE